MKNYKEYLRSSEWLIRKSKFVMKCVELNWPIKCGICGKKSYLNVHHLSYDCIGKELEKDEDYSSLMFLCQDCHYRWHKEEDFKDKWVSFEWLLNKY